MKMEEVKQLCKLCSKFLEQNQKFTEEELRQIIRSAPVLQFIAAEQLFELLMNKQDPAPDPEDLKLIEKVIDNFNR